MTTLTNSLLNPADLNSSVGVLSGYFEVDSFSVPSQEEGVFDRYTNLSGLTESDTALVLTGADKVATRLVEHSVALSPEGEFVDITGVEGFRGNPQREIGDNKLYGNVLFDIFGSSQKYTGLFGLTYAQFDADDLLAPQQEIVLNNFDYVSIIQDGDDNQEQIDVLRNNIDEVNGYVFVTNEADLV